jgi:Fms-interacting protein/Thoc5
MSQPPRKRPKIANSEDARGGDNAEVEAAMEGDGETPPHRMMVATPATSKPEGVQQQERAILQCRGLMEKLKDSLDALESCPDRSTLPNLLGDASIGILQLKVLQRRFLKKTQSTQSALVQLTAARDGQELRLQNLRYQQSLNESSMASSRGGDSTQLKRLVLSATAARTALAGKTGTSSGDETKVVQVDATMTEHDDTKTFQGQILKDFLGGDPRNPAHRSLIVSKLNRELAGRQTLEGQLRKCRQDLASRKELLAAKQKLLRDLPHRLAEMEKASIPLQKFCQKSLDVTQKLGTQRRQRLDLAATLPKALYTLFYQLQTCLDILITSTPAPDAENNDGAPGEDSLPVVDVSSGGATGGLLSPIVVLRIPIPTVSDGGALTFRPKKTATITFQYKDQADSVFASCSTEYDMGDLISEVFPGDRGEWTPEEGEMQGAMPTPHSSSSVNARPYQWCNYLAGLHIAPGEQSASKMHLSAKVVVKALMRRARAAATLHWILHCLSRKQHPIPVHSAMKDRLDSGGSNKAKLVRWTSVAPHTEAGGTDGSRIRIYEATIKYGSVAGDRDLALRILINMARYPSVPPQFQIASIQAQTSWGQQAGSLDSLQSAQTPLYNEPLVRLQNHVNRDVTQLVVSSDETTYDWILAHQMAEIAKRLGDTHDDPVAF